MQAFFLDGMPDAAGLFPRGRPYRQDPLEIAAVGLEEGEKGAIEAQPVLGGDADENCLKDAAQLDGIEVGGVHLQGEVVQKAHPCVGLFQFLLKNVAVDGQAPFFQGAVDGVQELFDVHRFGEVVVGSQAQAVERHLDIGGAGDHDDAEIGIAWGDILEDLVTVAVGQLDIEEDQGNPAGVEVLVEFPGTAGPHHGVSAAAEIVGEEQDDLR